MKKIFGILCTLIMFSGCGYEFEGSDNGDLDGFWLLTQVDTLQNGNSDDCRSRLVFWSFEGNVMAVQQLEKDNNSTEFLLRFDYGSDRLRVYSALVFNRKTGSRPLYEDEKLVLGTMGINEEEESYSIEKLNRRNMTLTNQSLRLYFERY